MLIVLEEVHPMQTQDLLKSPNRQKFDAVVDSSWNQKENSEVYTFIKRQLKYFNLEQELDIGQILFEGCIRGVSKIESGQDIQDPSDWLKSTCFYIILEHIRITYVYSSFDWELTTGNWEQASQGHAMGSYN